MNDPIAVMAYQFLMEAELLTLLRRGALLFNRIAVLGLHDAVKTTPPEFATQLEWLEEQGILFDLASKWKGKRSDVETEAAAKRMIDEIVSFCRERGKTLHGIAEVFGNIGLMTQLMLRPVSVHLGNRFETEAIPVSYMNLPNILKPNYPKHDVCQIVLNAIPMPDDSIPWEQILEFRSDPDSQSKFLGLRNWISEVARAKLTPNEIEEKIEWQIEQYTKHMQLHRMKINVGTLETFVTVTAECFENLVRLKFSKMAKALFTLKHRKIDLLEAEMKAPGREIAYIVKTREAFGNLITSE